MSIALTAKAKPAFLSVNYFNRFANEGADLVCSSGNTLRKRLFDMDPYAQWTSAGSDDTTQESITAGLWLPGMQTARDPDFCAILGHNLKAFTIGTSIDNGANYTVIHTETVEATDYTVFAFTGSSENKVQILADTTQTTNAEKLIGTIVFAKLNFQMAEKPTLMKPQPYIVRPKQAELAGNTIRTAYMYRSDASIFRRAWDMEHYVDSNTELAKFNALFRAGEDFLFMPRPGDRPWDIWQCRIKPGTYHERPWHQSNPDIHRVSYVIEETGGA